MTVVRVEQIDPALWGLFPKGYSEAFKLAVKRIPGFTWSPLRKAWIGYADAVATAVHHLEEAQLAEITGNPPTVKPLSCAMNLTEHERGLRHYQREGLSFLLSHSKEGAILCDGVGLGKSRQTLLAALRCELPIVIVCPAVVKQVWRREGEKVGVDVLTLSGMSPPPDLEITKDDGVVVINYDILPAWLGVLCGKTSIHGVKTLILDECHNLANEKSNRSKACKELRKHAKHCFGLTATPISVNPKNLWNIVDTVSPGRLGTKFFSFGLRHCDGHQKEIEFKTKGETKKVWDFNGAAHVEELAERLKFFVLRRTKEQVKLQLPPKLRQTIELEVSLEDQVLDFTWDQIASVRAAFQRAATAKIPHAVEFAVEDVQNGHHVVLFSYERKTARELEEKCRRRGIDAFLASGEMTADQRMEMVELAKKSPSVLSVTMRAMGEGIDLTYADHGIFVELDYLPRTFEQAEGRQHRPGQDRNVFFRYLIAMGTIDEKIRDIVLSRLDVAERLLGEGDGLGSGLAGKSDDEILAELRESLLRG